MVDIGSGLALFGAAIMFAIAAYGTSVSEAKVAMAGIGAIAEKEELFGKSLILSVLPETGTIFALVVVVLIIGALA